MKVLCRATLILAVALFTQRAYGQEWQSVTPSDLSSGPAVDKGADAEALFWNVQIEESESKVVLSHYIRIKIFTDHGVETQGRVDLPYAGRDSIKDIAGRTIQPDGSVIGLKPDAIFERTIVKGKKTKLQAKSFALPNVKPGTLVEYRWTEVLQEVDPFHLPVYVQREIPVQLFRFNVKTIPNVYSPFRVTGFNVHVGSLEKDKRGNLSGTIESIPSFHEEPAMPPEAAIRPWVLFFYDTGPYWSDLGRYLYDRVKPLMKITDDIRRQATMLIADAKSDEDKLRRLYDFCRTEIRRYDNDPTEEPVQRAADLAKENKTPSDTLKRKAGTGPDIDFLFASLAGAAGFEVHYAKLTDRGRYFFDDRYPTPHMLVSYNIAVRVNNDWRFFDPAGRYLPFGMLRWQEEGVRALLLDSDLPAFASTSFSPAEKSLVQRSLTARLDAEGTLEGDVRLVMFGHAGAGEKEDLDALTANEWEQYIKSSTQHRISSAEISNVQIKNVADRELPIIETYHVRVPGYAEKLGKRLFFEPGFFQHGKAPLLTTSTRTYPVYFPYPWTEDDIIMIDLPAGFALDNADQPPPVAAAGTTIKHEMHISVLDNRTVRYTRHLVFGADKKILFSVPEYGFVKSAFDAIGERDSHKLAVKESPATEVKPQ
jgi:hypothetical protein